MLDTVKDVLTKDIDLASVKKALTTDIDLNDILEMEEEVKKLKKLLATEVKLKEFLVQEIDIKKMFSSEEVVESSDEEPTELIGETITQQVKKLPIHDSSLIDSLLKEQKGILFIYKELMRYAREKNYSQVATRLEQFSNVMKMHYTREEKELYAYLRTYIQLKFPKRVKAFTELSLEMKNISIETFFSITQSPSIPLDDNTYDEFIKEFVLLGEHVNKRIEREQSVLFPMYEESNRARDLSN